VWPIWLRTDGNRRARRDRAPGQGGAALSDLPAGPGEVRRTQASLLAGQSLDERWELLIATRDWLWVMDELMDAWRDAQADARQAYDAWVTCSDVTACVVYRAEQDRADAPQNTLAEWAAEKPCLSARRRRRVFGRVHDPGHRLRRRGGVR
jgi:hypothetical protein